MPDNSMEMEVEVFRTGDYGEKGVYTDEDIARVAASYSPELHEAPVTLDHAQEGPAHGWVAGLRVVGDRLVAQLRQISPNLMEALRKGAFRKRSVELYRAFRETGAPYLKAVSFLGAAAPRVVGLQDPTFRDEEPDVVVYTADILPEKPEPIDNETLRGRLVESRAWNPRWEEQGIFDVFAALDVDAREQLVTVLSTGPAPVTPGEQERSAPAVVSQFSESLRGIDNPASAEAHLRALQFLATHPDHDYRSALLAVNNESV